MTSKTTDPIASPVPVPASWEIVSSTAAIKRKILVPLVTLETSATANQAYPFRPISLRRILGNMPTHWGIFVVHNTGDALDATGSSHFIKYTPIYETVT